MKSFLKFWFFVVIPIGLFISCNSTNEEKQVISAKTAPNVILLIGDGMGLSEISASFFYNPSESTFNLFRKIGLIKTSSSKQKVTDSAAGATAFSCGQKTYNGAVGIANDSTELENLVEILSNKGYNTAVVSTSSITHATPASFYAHVPSRRMQYEIAEQLVTSDVDFFAGGGLKWFTNREDGRNLIDEMGEEGFIINPEKEYVYHNNDKKFGFLLAEDGMPSMLQNRGDFLPEFTNLALQYLSGADNNFFLVVEGSQIDWGGHDNNAKYLISEMIDFDNTVKVAMDYAMSNDNTLVIVLADHETGGFALAMKDGDYSEIDPVFATTGHTATLMPVFAYGPSEETFEGIYENNEIFNKIIAAVSN